MYVISDHIRADLAQIAVRMMCSAAKRPQDRTPSSTFNHLLVLATSDCVELPEEPNPWDETARVAMRALQIAMRAYCDPNSSDRVRTAAFRYLIRPRRTY